MSARRVASIGSALVVAGIAFLASYSHMRGLALRYGQTEVIADLLPVSVDGMLVVATVALGDGRRHRWSAWVAFWTGVAASVVANVLAAEPSAIARCISAWPAIAFLLVVEVITRGGRVRVRKVDTQEDTAQDTTPDSEPDTSATSPVEVPATTPATGPVTPAAAKRTPARTVKAAKAAPGTATKVAKLRAKQPDITQAEAAAKLATSERTVRRYWAATEPATTPATGPVNGHDVPDLIAATGGTQ